MRLHLLSLTCCALLLASCVAKNPATGNYNLVTMTEDQEFALGHKVAVGGIKDGGGMYEEMPELTEYLRQLGKDVVGVSERPDQPFRFKLLDSPTVNAWAIPGYIAVHRGILPLFNDEAELMTVLGHEVGHVTARHTVRAEASTTIAKIGIFAAQVAVAAQTGSSQAADATGQLGVGVARIGLAGYGRTYELEADQLGLRYMSRLGYDPEAAANTFRSLKAYRELTEKIQETAGEKKEVSAYHTLLASHPEPEKRADILDNTAQTTLVANKKLNKAEYLKKIDGLAWGTSLEQDGVYGFRRHYDKNNRIVMDIPDKWFFPRQAGLPMATNPEEKIYMTASAEESLNSPEEELFYKHPKAQELQAVSVSGAKAHTGTFEDGKKKMRAVMVQLGNPTSQQKPVMLSFLFVADKEHFSKADPQFKAIIDSLRRLSLREAERLEPLRIRIHKVKKGETVKELAGRLPLELFHEEHFRLINGLHGKKEVKEGDLVKLIVDPNRSKIK